MKAKYFIPVSKMVVLKLNEGDKMFVYRYGGWSTYIVDEGQCLCCEEDYETNRVYYRLVRGEWAHTSKRRHSNPFSMFNSGDIPAIDISASCSPWDSSSK